MKADAWREPGFWGFRILRWQFDVRDHRKVPQLLSERYPEHVKGSSGKEHHVGRYCFRWGMLERTPDYEAQRRAPSLSNESNQQREHR